MPYNQTLLTEPVHLNFDQRGSGTPLLLLHGFPFDHTIWQAQVRDLEENARIITPDLRGHGKSPAPEGAYSMDLMAKDVFTLLDHLGVYKAIWVGHSMGGYVTLAAYRLEPERFSGIGFVASNYLADSPEAKAKRYETAEKVSQEGAKAALNPKALKEGTPKDSENFQKAKQITLATSPAGIIGTVQAMAARPDSTETLKSVKVPALVVGGSGDQLFKPEIPQKMAELMPKAKLVMADGGHLAMMEDPDVVTEALRDLLKRVEVA